MSNAICTHAANWDKTAAEYSKLGIPVPLLYPCQNMLAAMNQAASFASATSILDVGCGPGTAVTLLVQGYGKQIPPDASLLATDFSQGMVDMIASKRQAIVAEGTDVANCWGRLEAKVMDAQDLSGIQSDSISHVMGSLVYFMLPDAGKGLREAYRVLKEGGVFACTGWSQPLGAMLLAEEAARRVRPDKVGKLFEIAEEWTSTQGVRAQLETAGFRDAHAEYVKFDWKVEDPAQNAAMTLRSNNPATESIVGSFSQEELDRCCEEYVKLLADHGGIIKGIVVLGVGRK